MLQLLSLRNGMTISKEMFLNELYGGLKNCNQDVLIASAAQKARRHQEGPTVNIQAGWGFIWKSRLKRWARFWTFASGARARR